MRLNRPVLSTPRPDGLRAVGRSFMIGLTLAALLSGCSSTRLAYNNASWLLTREIGKYACPPKKLRETLKRDMDQFLRWHRRHELPRYASALRRIARGLGSRVTRKLLEEIYATLEGARQRASRRAAKVLVRFGMSLGSRQAGCLAVKLQAGHKKRLVEMLGSREDYLDRVTEKIVDTLEPWMGAPTKAQRALITGMIPPQPRARAVAAARYKKGLRLVAAIISRDRVKKRAWLERWVTDPYALYTVQERTLLKGRDRRNRERLLPVARTLSAAQRKKLAGKLLDYARDFDVLARQ